MVAQMRAKPGGDKMAITIGDCADVPVPGTYRLIYFASLMLRRLLTVVAQDPQYSPFSA
jgi:hypothetical protein